MISIGELLTKTRVEKHYSLGQASAATHIRLHYLQALERDERSELPSDVQGRGFLRLYASYLGLPVQMLLDAWSGISPLEVPEPTTPPQAELVNEEILVSPNLALPAKPVIESEPNVAGIEVIRLQMVTSKSQEIYQEIGAVFKKQRGLLGLSLDDVERFTHIRSHYLESIENGQIDLLPSAVQGRGMLNNFARFLELDADGLLLRYADALQSQRLENLKPLPRSRKGSKPATRASSWRQVITLDLLIAGGIIVLLMSFGIWSLSQIASKGNNQGSPDPSAISDLLVSPSLAVVPSDRTTPLSTVSVTKTPLPGEETLPATTSPANTITSIPNLENAPLQLTVIAQQRAYLRITSDGKVVYSGRVVPGNAYAFTGKLEIILLTGNAAAFKVLFNQTDLGSLGVLGQVLSIVFTKDGAKTPTSLPSLTPTATKQVTISPTKVDQTQTLQSTPTVTPFIP